MTEYSKNNHENGKMMGDDKGMKTIVGTDGNDVLYSSEHGSKLYGLAGNDTLIGGNGRDILSGGPGVDTLTGGANRDSFQFDADPFDGQTPKPVAGTHISGVNNPDFITDFQVDEDNFALGRDALGLSKLSFSDGKVADLSGSANVLVLQDSFPNGFVAAQTIADNNELTGGAGVFIYYNSNLQIDRLVYSADLAHGGNISVLANLQNVTGSDALALLPSFSAQNFTLV